MQQNWKLATCFGLLVLCVTSLMSCKPASLIVGSSSVTASEALINSVISEHMAETQEQWRQFLNKPAYTSPVHVAIDPALLNPVNHTSQRLDLTNLLDHKSFSLQSIATGPVVLQEVLTLDKRPLVLTRAFRVPDATLRYTLHLKLTGSDPGESKISINLNGQEYVLDRRLEKQKEIELPGLLLYANNSLQMRLSGKPGTSVTITILQGGEAGVILRKGDHLTQPDTQAAHIKANDQNIFNPNDDTSLGGLLPAETTSAVQNRPPYVTGVVVDGESPTLFESGRLVLRLRNPDIALPILQNLYGAKVLHKLDIPGFPQLTTYYLEFDLSKSPIADAGNLIQSYREKIPAPFKDFVFASTSGFKTFVILMDILVHHEEFIVDWELNIYAESPTADLPPVDVPDWNTPATNPGAAPINNRGWWLRDTFTREAWNLSIGTGTKAIYLDAGYFQAIDNSKNYVHPEWGHRVDLNFSPFQNVISLWRKDIANGIDPRNPLEYVLKDQSINKQSTNTHGLITSMVAFAERDNNIGTVGVAPNANFAPYHQDQTAFEMSFALSTIFTENLVNGKQVDVIGFNGQFDYPTNWKPLKPVTPDPSDPNGKAEYTGPLLEGMLALITVGRDIPVVVAAGNEAKRKPSPNHVWMPSSLDGLPCEMNDPLLKGKPIQLIIAGGAQRDASKPTPAPSLAARDNPNPNGEIQSWFQGHEGSNIGPGYIWAPAFDIEHADENQQVAKTNGTSFACPFLTGTIALMKSRNPDLHVEDIKRFLALSQTRINITHEAPTIFNQPFVDVQDAVERAIEAAHKNPADFEAKPYVGFIKSGTSGQKRLVLNQSANTQLSAPHKQEVELLRSVSDPVWNSLQDGNQVELRGWLNEDQEVITAGKNGLGLGKLELLEIKSLTTPPQITSVNISQNNVITQNFVKNQPNKIQIKGQNLLANLNTSSGSKSLNLIFHEVGSTTKFIYFQMDFDQPEELLNNQGTEATFVLDPSKTADSAGINQLDSSKKYQISVLGPNGESNLFGPTGDFTVSADGSGGGGFGVTSVGTSQPADPPLPPPIPPSYINLWLLRDTQRLAVKPDQVVGVAINDQDLSQLQIEVIKGDQHIQASVIEVAQNFAAFQIPPDAQKGVQDILLKIGADRVLMKDAVDVQPAGPVTLFWDKRDIYTNGTDSSLLTLHLRQADDSPVPDGSLYFIRTSDASTSRFDYADPMYQPFPGRGFLVDGMAKTVNSEIKLKVTSTRKIAPGEYGTGSWPSPGQPALQIVDVCSPNYSSSSGWYCDQRIGEPESQPRLYLKDIYRMEVTPNNPTVQAGGQTVLLTATFWDRAGLPVPDGTPIFGSGSSYGNFSFPPVTTQNELKIAYTSYQASCYGQDIPITEGISLKGASFASPAHEFGGVTVTVAPYGRCPGY